MTQDAIAAIDIGGTKIALGLASLDGRTLPFRRFHTRIERGPRAIIEEAADELERMAAEACGSSPPASGAAGRWIARAG